MVKHQTPNINVRMCLTIQAATVCVGLASSSENQMKKQQQQSNGKKDGSNDCKVWANGDVDKKKWIWREWII